MITIFEKVRAQSGNEFHNGLGLEWWSARVLALLAELELRATCRTELRVDCGCLHDMTHLSADSENISLEGEFAMSFGLFCGIDGLWRWGESCTTLVAEVGKTAHLFLTLWASDHLSPPQCTGLPRFPRGKAYRIYTASTMIPMPLRIAYYSLSVKPKTKISITAVSWLKSYEFNSGARGRIRLQVNFLTEISRRPPLTVLAFASCETRASLRVSHPHARK